MLKKIVLKVTTILSTFILASCGNSGNENIINTNFDDIKLWNKAESRLVYADFAKTGKYIGFADSTAPYSIGIEGSLSELTNKPFKKVIVKGVMRTKNMQAKGGFVVVVQDENGPNLYLKMADATLIVKKPNEWFDFTLEADLSDPNVMKPKNYFKSFGWATGKEVIYFDDISFTFE
ncbi:MAG: hypothetical protein IT239_07025 [Bacteroidia bacterium]|nr:hypothetical protein [Bacteroidia bacterium]